MPFIGLIKVQVFTKGRGTLNNKLMRSKSEGGVGGGWGCANFSRWHCEAVIETEVVSLKSQVIFELECHHHSWSNFLFFTGLHVYVHIRFQIFLFKGVTKQENPCGALANCSLSKCICFVHEGTTDIIISLSLNLKIDPKVSKAVTGRFLNQGLTEGETQTHIHTATNHSLIKHNKKENTIKITCHVTHRTTTSPIFRAVTKYVSNRFTSQTLTEPKLSKQICSIDFFFLNYNGLSQCATEAMMHLKKSMSVLILHFPCAILIAQIPSMQIVSYYSSRLEILFLKNELY